MLAIEIKIEIWSSMLAIQIKSEIWSRMLAIQIKSEIWVSVFAIEITSGSSKDGCMRGRFRHVYERTIPAGI